MSTNLNDYMYYLAQENYNYSFYIF